MLFLLRAAFISIFLDIHYNGVLSNHNIFIADFNYILSLFYYFCALALNSVGDNPVTDLKALKKTVASE